MNAPFDPGDRVVFTPELASTHSPLHITFPDFTPGLVNRILKGGDFEVYNVKRHGLAPLLPDYRQRLIASRVSCATRRAAAA